VYDPTSDTAPTQVVSFTTSSKFVGWQDDENLFMLVLAEYKQPLQLEQIVIATGERRVVTSLPNNETVYCARPSPDGRYILFGMETETYLFDVTARTFTPIDVAARRAIWAYDAEALLTFSLNTEVAIVPLTNTAETAGITAVSIELKPPSGPPWISGTLNTSPDGQWLVGCFGYATNQQAWLYHLPTQTWQQLAHGCIEVVGWPTR
jgi:Tol biopolymer transport system component